MLPVAGVLVLGLLSLPVVGLILGRRRALLQSARFEAMGMPVDAGATDLAEIVWETILLAGVVSAGALTLGLALAWFEHRVASPGRKLLGILVLLPMAVPSYLLAGAIQRAVEPSGLLGGLFGLTEPFTGFWPAATVLIVVTAPYVHLIVGAALSRLSASEEEAARSLGAGPGQRFFRLVLPRLRPSLAFALLIVALYTISDFGAVSVLDCRVLTWRIYQAQSGMQIVSAVDMGFGILGLVVPLILLSRLLHGRARPERGVSNPRPIPPARPGPALLAIALGLPIAVITVGVVVPTVELVTWLRDGLANGEELAPLGDAVKGTLYLAGLGLAVTVSFAWLTASVSAAFRRVAPMVDGAVFLLSGLPGILVAFGLALAALWVPTSLGMEPIREPLRAAGVLVAVGYAMRYVAEAHGVLTPTLLRVDERQAEVARSLGAGPLRRFWRVQLPQIAPGLVAASLLVFLALVKELPVTLMVAPLDTRTLAYRVWERYSEAFLADAAAAGLLLMGMAVSIQLLTLRWRHSA
ncbi:MAG: iron(III) transport system permease protein [Myxococcota bacterium]